MGCCAAGEEGGGGGAWGEGCCAEAASAGSARAASRAGAAGCEGPDHQKACPMLKKKLKWPARPTQGGDREEFSQELEGEVEVEPYPMTTG